MTAVFQEMIALAGKLGTVTAANWYDFGYLSVTGRTEAGERFQLTLDLGKKKEEEHVV